MLKLYSQKCRICSKVGLKKLKITERMWDVLSHKRLMALALCCTTLFTNSIGVCAANKYVNMTLTYDYTQHKYSAEEL